MLRSDSIDFVSFGEIYFSTIFNKSIKAWHLHKKNILNYACISGEVKLVLFDDRSDSKSSGKYSEHILTPKNFFLITIPPLIWNGFKSIESKPSIIANCTDIPHSENEIERKKFNDPSINYDWNIKFK